MAIYYHTFFKKYRSLAPTMEQKTIKNEIQIEIGKHLKKCRKKMGLSLRQLYTDIGIDYSHISKIERGEGNLTIETLAIFIKYFKIQPKVLFNFQLEYDFESYTDKNDL